MQELHRPLSTLCIIVEPIRGEFFFGTRSPFIVRETRANRVLCSFPRSILKKKRANTSALENGYEVSGREKN